MIPTPEELATLRKLVGHANQLDASTQYRPLWPTSEMQSVLALLDEVFEKIGEYAESVGAIKTDAEKVFHDNPKWPTPLTVWSADAETKLEALRSLREKYGVVK